MQNNYDKITSPKIYQSPLKYSDCCIMYQQTAMAQAKRAHAQDDIYQNTPIQIYRKFHLQRQKIFR